jgi:release factor glutamine methyltransferase
MNPLGEEIAALLESGGIAGFAAEADLIVCAAKDRESANFEDTARTMAALRAAGAPLAQVIGRAVFMGIELAAGRDCLAPRLETELLCNTAIGALRSAGLASPRVIDMCSGCGNIACAIAHHLPGARVWAGELTDACVDCLRKNVDHLGLAARVVVSQGDLFAGLPAAHLAGTIDAVVCNPPYISRRKLETDSAKLLEHEPAEAFDGGPYGLSIHQRVVREALPYLRPGGMLFFEIGLGQERQVSMLFNRAKAYENICLVENEAGEVRVVWGRKRAP